MPTSYPELYFPILVQIAIAVAVAGGMIGASYLLGNRVRNRVKDLPYECGIVPEQEPAEPHFQHFWSDWLEPYTPSG